MLDRTMYLFYLSKNCPRDLPIYFIYHSPQVEDLQGQGAHGARRGRRYRALSVLSRCGAPSGLRVPQRRGLACERAACVCGRSIQLGAS